MLPDACLGPAQDVARWDPEVAAKLRIEERELDAGGLN